MDNIISYIQNITTDQIIHILVSILIALLFNIFSYFISYIVISIVSLNDKNKKEKIAKNIKSSYIYKPLMWYIKLIGIYFGILYFSPEASIMGVFNKLFRICTIIFVCRLLTSYVGNNKWIIEKINSKINSNKKIGSLITKLVSFVVYFIGFALILSEFGYDISTLVAGLGISGVVVALAAQDTAKNLFGGAMILFDRPFEIGDWIQTSTLEGTVEDISFRSTRIRTFDGSLVTIPNSVITNDSVINWSKMKKRRIVINLELLFDTSLKKVYNFVSDVNKMLNDDENILKENIWVNFKEIASNGYLIQISFYTNITTTANYLKLKEEVNYKIMQILESKKIGLAYNSYDIYIKK